MPCLTVLVSFPCPVTETKRRAVQGCYACAAGVHVAARRRWDAGRVMRAGSLGPTRPLSARHALGANFDAPFSFCDGAMEPRVWGVWMDDCKACGDAGGRWVRGEGQGSAGGQGCSKATSTDGPLVSREALHLISRFLGEMSV